ncbi:AAA family ATPase [Candidatus Micrarchaeota archaeon]|nr:AAA family ATPase [Candidatus Micrarchaeota archaeon]MBD3417601.1 AAA family ATPase [Candidatus Micrarchaeota archaeon]
MLVLVCGLPGAGKSTLAKALAEKLSAVYLSSDIIRMKMLSERTYSEHEKYKVYGRMVEEAGKLLSAGKAVVCDATFYKKKTRAEMRGAAEKAGAELHIILCQLDEQTLEERMEQRGKEGAGASEADFSIYLKVKGLFEPIENEHLVLDTSVPVEEQVGTAAEYIEKKSGWKPEELGMEFKETHISWVFLSGDFAYKVKKPVKFSFLDFSSRDKRREYCEEEVRLNKRLSPEIYLGVVPLVREGNSLRFGGNGRPLDYAVKMKRMGRTMDRALEEGEVDRGNVEEVAKEIAGFHNAVPVIQDPRYNSPEMVKEQIDDLGSVKETVESACGMGEKVEFVLEKSDLFIRENEGLMRNRQVDGMVRDCHGDLHTSNVFVAEKKYIFDCIEFSEDFRFIDIASEVAFMAMDLDARGREDLSEVFVGKYLELSGDPNLMKLLDFYKCYRANVRAKVAALEYLQNPTEEGKRNVEKYLSLAQKYAGKL